MSKPRKYLKGLKNQIGVIDALLFRELLTKKNFSYLGFVGILLEPLLITSVYLIILRLIRIDLKVGINIFLFFATGILIFSFFVSIVTRSANAMKANKNLFYYKRVKPIDTVIARTFIEATVVLIVYFLILSIIFYINNEIILDNLPILLLVFTLIIVLAFSVGLIVLIIGNKFQNTQNLLPLFTRPLFFTSGAIFPIEFIPSNLRRFILWNPLLHASELARNALDKKYLLVEQISLNYLLFNALIFLGLALFIYQKEERKLIVK